MKLTAKQQRFIEEYLVDLNATQAAIRAGYSEKTAGFIGAENLKKPNIAAEIAKRRGELSEKTEITQEKVLERYWKLATANPNELSEFRRVPCRYCWGKNHAYQWRTEREFQAACDEAAAKDKPLPTDEGGYGYTRKREPNPDCPECDGFGWEKLILKDTRNLPPDALILLKSAKQTKDGLTIEVHDQTAALTNVAKHLGMFKTQVDLDVGASEDAMEALAKLSEQNRLKSLELAQKVAQRQEQIAEQEES